MHVILAATALLYAVPVSAAAPVQKWSPWVDVEGKGGTDRSLGIVDMFAPVWQDSDSLVFLNPRLRLDDQQSEEYNFGLGYRHLTRGWVYGAYGYIDHNRSPSENDFYQLTLGGEAGTTDWKYRTNFYLPFGQRSYGVPGGGGAVLNGTTIQLVSGEERSLHGADIEAGWRVPLHDAEALQQLWLYAGAYHFDANGVKNVTGPRIRAEYDIDDVSVADHDLRLRLAAELQDDAVRDTQGFLGVRVGIPLGSGYQSRRQLSALERRMSDPVVRDVDIVTGGGYSYENTIDPNTGNPYNITVVEGGDDVAAKVAAAGNDALVIFLDSNGDIVSTNAITMLPGQIFLGAGADVPVEGITSGRSTFYQPAGNPAFLSGNYDNTAFDGLINMANDTKILGLDISNGDGSFNEVIVVNANGVTNFEIAGNVIDAFSAAGGANRLVNITGASSGVVADNFMDLIEDNSFGVISDDLLGAPIGIEVSNNLIIGLGDNETGISLRNGTNTVSDNVVFMLGTGSTGIRETASTDSVISDNAVLLEDGVGIRTAQTTNLTISENQIGADTSNVTALDINTVTNIGGVDNDFVDFAGGATLCTTAGVNTGSVDFGTAGTCP